jgi:hypothetical protein
MVKFSTAAEELPLFVTATEVPGAPVVTVPTVMVAAAPLVPFVPLVPLVPPPEDPEQVDETGKKAPMIMGLMPAHPAPVEAVTTRDWTPAMAAIASTSSGLVAVDERCVYPVMDKELLVKPKATTRSFA